MVYCRTMQLKLIDSVLLAKLVLSFSLFSGSLNPASGLSLSFQVTRAKLNNIGAQIACESCENITIKDIDLVCS